MGGNVVADLNKTHALRVKEIVHVEEGKAAPAKLEAKGFDAILGTALVEESNDVFFLRKEADHVDTEHDIAIESPGERVTFLVIDDTNIVELMGVTITHTLGLRERFVKVRGGTSKRKTLIVGVQAFVGHEKVSDDHGGFVDGVEGARAETEIVVGVGDQLFGEGVGLIAISGDGHADGSLDDLLFGTRVSVVLEELKDLDMVESSEGALRLSGGKGVDGLGQFALKHGVGNGGAERVKVSIIVLGSSAEGVVRGVELVVQDDFGLDQTKTTHEG